MDNKKDLLRPSPITRLNDAVSLGVALRRVDGIAASLAEINQVLTGGQRQGDFGIDEQIRHRFMNKLTAFVYTAHENRGSVRVWLGDDRSALEFEMLDRQLSVSVTPDSSSLVKDKWRALEADY